jgi:DNA-binding transcriptional LysR family regulator
MTDKAEYNLRRWADELNPFASITVDQLRTYVTVHETGSSRSAIKVLGRDQSSIDKQLKTLDEHFWDLSKQRLFVKPPERGAELRFTRAGETVFHLAEKLLRELSTTRTQLEKVNRLRIAMLGFLAPLFAKLDRPIAERFRQCGRNPERELIHVSATNIQTCLHDPTIDFALGGVISSQRIDEHLEFVRWKTEEFVLLSNFPIDAPPVPIHQLRSLNLPLILNDFGVIKEFVKATLGGDYGLNIVERCTDLQFSLDLLRLRMHQACTILMAHIAEEAIRQQGTNKVLSIYPLSGFDLRYHVGLFRRAGEEHLYEATHPIRLFWDTFKSMAAKAEEFS